MKNPLLALLIAAFVSTLSAEQVVVAPPVPESSPEWSLPGQFEVVVEAVGPSKEKVAVVVAGFSGLRLDYTRELLKKLPVTILRNSSELRAKGSKAKLEAAGAKAKLIKQEKAGGSQHTGASAAGASGVGSTTSKGYQPGGAAGSLSAIMKKRQAKTGPPRVGSMGARRPVHSPDGVTESKAKKKAGSSTAR